MKNTRSVISIVLIFGMISLALLYQNCAAKQDFMGKAINDRVIQPSRNPGSEATPTPTPGGSPAPSPSPSPGGSPGGAAIDPNCMTNSSYNACIFLKNPLAHANIVNTSVTSLSPAPSFSRDYSTLQTYGVNITGITGQYLENSSINVQVESAQRVTATSGSWKYVYANDPNHKVAQVMAYYFINQQIEQMNARSGKFYAQNKNIKVIAYTTNRDVENNAHWDSSKKEVVMGIFKQNGTSEAGISADVYCHEMGHANIYYANAAAVDYDATQNYCYQPTGTYWKCECRTKKGCMFALNEGQADFHAAILFPQRTAIGEMFMNNINGFQGCISRSPDNFLASPKTAQQVFDSCGKEIHWMGVIYNAIWYAVWKKQDDNGKKDLEKLFTEHFVRLVATDTFPTAIEKAKSLDSSLFGGKFTNDFNTEVAKYQF